MKRFWIALCGVLGMALYVGTAHAAFWQVVRDTPIREDASTDAKRLDTARKGWIVNDMTGSGSSPQWIKVVEVQKHIGDGMAYAHLVYRTPELLAREWYGEVNMCKYVAYIIDTLNHDQTISHLLDQSKKIHNVIDNYKRKK